MELPLGKKFGQMGFFKEMVHFAGHDREECGDRTASPVLVTVALLGQVGSDQAVAFIFVQEQSREEKAIRTVVSREELPRETLKVELTLVVEQELGVKGLSRGFGFRGCSFERYGNHVGL